MTDDVIDCESLKRELEEDSDSHDHIAKSQSQAKDSHNRSKSMKSIKQSHNEKAQSTIVMSDSKKITSSNPSLLDPSVESSKKYTKQPVHGSSALQNVHESQIVKEGGFTTDKADN